MRLKSDIIFQMKENDIDKYKSVEGEHDAQNFGEVNIKKFVDDYLADKVPQHFLTETLPEDWDKKPVKVSCIALDRQPRYLCT